MDNLPVPRKPNPKDKETGLTQRMRQIVEFVFDNPMLEHQAIADHFKISRTRVYVILHHPKVLDAYPVLARNKIRGMVPKAIKRFNDLMNQEANLAVSEKVTTRVLDSQKVLAPVEITHIHELGHATIDELHRIVNQSQQILEPVIDGELINPDDPQVDQSLA